ncbi:MAG: large conductance mechanosensitive channel protein MscL [Lachnospiraceae bacterium]|nr:large conductance mechanosensitive channel protein MscL [Lachnospiraceae bacterium]
MKSFIKEFKEFISQGNVMTMAVGIIIGGAFTAIITSVVEDIIGPLIGLIIGGLDFSSISVGVGDAQIMFANFIQAVINFLITAFVLFLIIKSFNKMKEKADALRKKEAEEAAAEDPSEEILLLREIRDSLKK